MGRGAGDPGRLAEYARTILIGGGLPFLAGITAMVMLTKTTPESHEYSRLGTVESLVERGTYRLDESIFIDTIDKIYRDGHYYSHQTPLLATVTAPVYAVFRVPGLKFNNRGRLVVTYLFSLLTNGLELALTAVAFWYILAFAGTTGTWRNVLAVLLPAATWLLPYGSSRTITASRRCSWRSRRTPYCSLSGTARPQGESECWEARSEWSQPSNSCR